MKGLNKVTLIGTVGKDPEVKHIQDGTSVAKFSLATNESYKDKNGNKVENTDWHNCTAWRQLAEIVEKYIKKGTNLYIEGNIKYRTYGEEGNKKYFTEIVINKMIMLGGGQKNNDQQNQQNQSAQYDRYENVSNDDLPF